VGDGVLCVYNHAGLDLGVENVSIDVVANANGERAILVQDLFLVPVSVLALGKRESVVLRLAASTEAEVVANIVAVVTLDVRALTKIELLIEMAPSNQREP
jgi:hypothetical protein